MLFRFEYNVSTDELTQIFQRAYRNGDSVIVLDEWSEVPEGYEEFDPEVEVEND